MNIRTREINMKKDLIERLRRFLIAHDTIGTPVSMTKEEAKKKIQSIVRQTAWTYKYQLSL